jgi:tight adherence protein B
VTPVVMTVPAATVSVMALVGVAVALCWPPAWVPPSRKPRHRFVVPRWAIGACSGLLAAVVVWADGRRVFLGLISGAAVGAGATLLRRARDAKAAEGRQQTVVEVCEALAGELRAGQPPVRSLEHVADQWRSFEPVAAAARLGADVPTALRTLAERPGSAGLREVASAWQVSERAGAALASALGEVAASARSRQATRRLVRSELASAQATARLVVLLPVAALAMGHGIGADPLGFLLHTVPGLCCLAGGVALAAAGLFWIDHIATAVLRP